MTLLRAAARTMLASYFVASGVKALRNPGPLVPLAEPLADKFVPLVKQYAPDQIAGYVPEDAEAAGPGERCDRRSSAAWPWPPATAAGSVRCCWPARWSPARSPSTRSGRGPTRRRRPLDRRQFLKNVSLLGGVLLASADTEGKPSLAWRAQKGGHHLAKDTRKAAKKLTNSQ